MKEKILSISVACYNLGDMILDNMKSFCESSVADEIELIITDDGSKDNTPDIVEEYAKNYPNTVRLIRKENGGPGSTVNSGIKHATGKYFRMVDGDDWVATENLEEYISMLKNSDADMIISDYEVFDNQNKEVIEKHQYDLDINKVHDFNETFEKIPLEMHAIAYKTSIIKNIELDNGFYTDVEYVLYPIKYVNTVEYFNKTIYMYRVAQANQSVSPTSRKKNINQHDIVLTHLIEYYLQCNGDLKNGQRQYIAKRIGLMADSQLGTLLLFDSNKNQKKEIKEYITRINNTHKDISSEFKKYKKYKSLAYSKCLLYPLISKMYKKKEGLI